MFYRRPLVSDVGWRRDRRDRGEPGAEWDAPSVTRENYSAVISLSNHDKHVKSEGYWNHSLIFKAQETEFNVTDAYICDRVAHPLVAICGTYRGKSS